MKLTCNKCNNKLTDTKGCVFCEDFKREHISIEEEAIELKAADIGHKMLNLAAKDLARLETVHATAKGYDPGVSSEIQRAAKTITSLIDSLRKLKEEGAAEESKSFSEEKAIFIEWLNDKPVMLRRDVLRSVYVTFEEDFQVAAKMK